MKHIFTSEEAEKIVNRILVKLNGVTDIATLKKRLATLYFGDNIRQSKTFRADITRARKFFQVIKLIVSGTGISEIARKTKVNPDTVRVWIKLSSLPNLIRIGKSIPDISPESGMKWLPLDARNTSYNQFLQVPEKTKSVSDISDVLNQLSDIRNSETDEYEKQFGKMSKGTALMYLLGLVFSDCTINSYSKSTCALELTATMEYSWAADLCKGFSYALAKIGISTTREKNKEDKDEHGNVISLHYRWLSKYSPLLLWIRRTLLGLDESAPKSYSQVNMDWTFEMPKDWRISLLQGISDGDGFVSNNLVAGISSKSNKKFILDLLTSLGVNSRFTKGDVIIGKRKDIHKIKSLPMFKHAIGRQKALDELNERIAYSSGKPFSEQEISLITKLRRKGYSDQKIAEEIWKQYNIFRRGGTLWLLRKRLGIA